MEHKRLALLIAMVQALQAWEEKIGVGRCTVKTKKRSGPIEWTIQKKGANKQGKGLWAFGTGQ